MEQDEKFGFAIPFDGEAVYCEAVMQDNGFKVLFNGMWVTSIVMDELGRFKQTANILSNKLIRQIGERVEAYYM